MNKIDYQKALRAAKVEFERLVQERVELDQRIVRLQQKMADLTGLREGNHDRFTRLTSAIRQVMADAIYPLRPPELRCALLKHGLNMTQYANNLAVIHNTLSRLERQGEVTEVSGGWTLTEKGRLACQMDLLDFIPAD